VQNVNCIIFTPLRLFSCSFKKIGYYNHRLLLLDIDQRFFGADTNISAMDGPIANTDISKIFKSCFLLLYQKYKVFYALPF